MTPDRERRERLKEIVRSYSPQITEWHLEESCDAIEALFFSEGEQESEAREMLDWLQRVRGGIAQDGEFNICRPVNGRWTVVGAHRNLRVAFRAAMSNRAASAAQSKEAETTTGETNG